MSTSRNWLFRGFSAELLLLPGRVETENCRRPGSGNADGKVSVSFVCPFERYRLLSEKEYQPRLITGVLPFQQHAHMCVRVAHHEKWPEHAWLLGFNGGNEAQKSHPVCHRGQTATMADKPRHAILINFNPERH